MKNVLVLIVMLMFTLSAEAGFIKIADINKCDDVKVYLNAVACGQDCVEVTSKKHNCEYSKLVDEMIDDLESPIFDKKQIEACSDEVDCDAKHAVKDCSEGYDPIKNYDIMESYCVKHLGYNLKASGKKVLGEDVSLKAVHSEKMAKKAARVAKIKKGLERRVKCEKVMQYITGKNAEDDLTEAQTDAMVVAFGSIHDAAEKCQYKKLKRLVSEVTDPGYTSLRDELLEILK